MVFSNGNERPDGFFSTVEVMTLLSMPTAPTPSTHSSLGPEGSDWRYPSILDSDFFSKTRPVHSNCPTATSSSLRARAAKCAKSPSTKTWCGTTSTQLVVWGHHAVQQPHFERGVQAERYPAFPNWLDETCRAMGFWKSP